MKSIARCALVVALLSIGSCVGRAAPPASHGKAERTRTTTTADNGVGRIDGPGTDFELVKVIVLNRHGHRAPNLPFWTLCPNEIDNREKFKTMPEDLTAVGFDEEYRCGIFIHELYPDFIGPYYNRTLHFIQAAGEPRTLQSALAITQGAFPSTKTNPSRKLPNHPSLVPVFAANQNREYFLNDVPCFAETARLIQKWLPTEGASIAQEHKGVVKRMLDLCGTPEAAARVVSMDFLIKVVVDGIVFEHDFNISPFKGKLSPADFFELRNLSTAFLFGKLYGTDEQKTFTAAEFPHFLLKSLQVAQGLPATSKWDGNQNMALHTPLNIFVVHREEIYGMKFFFDWKYHALGMAPGEVPAGSAFTFEILRQRSTGTVFLRVKMWNPRQGEVAVDVSGGCAHTHMCTIDEVSTMYHGRVNRTGSWDRLCNFSLPDNWKPDV